MSLTALLAALAMLPAMLGPLPLEQGSEFIALALCGGGSVNVARDRGASPLPGAATTPCCAKGCRGSSKRRQIDPRQ
ncbi:hypothetical protein GCM10009127_22490 [Alteraurantiacibacter aestuarii]|uniref:hypothetical protein n=1 Tax=Alteraurantiacibacter aestuarii TaxID=650004 RepID=UPI0031D3FBB0